MALNKPSSALGISSINIDQAEETGGILGVFSKPPVDTLLQKSNIVEILPLNPISKGSPLEFILGPWHDKFVDTSSIRLCGQIRLRKVADNGALSNTTEADDVSVCSNFPLAMWKSLSVLANDTEVMDVRSSCYPLKSYLDCLLSYNPHASASILSTHYFTKQTAGTENRNKALSSGTDYSAFHANKRFVIGDKLVEFMSGTFCELFDSQRLMIPGIQFKLKFLPSENDYPLISVDANKGKYTLELINAKILCKLVTVEQNLMPTILSRLDKGESAIYPFVRTSVSVHTVPAGVSSFDFSNLYNGKSIHILISFSHLTHKVFEQ